MKTKKMKNKIINFFKTPYSIILYLIIVLIALFCHCHYLANSENLYIFNGYKDDYTIMNGSLYIGRNIHTLTSPNILYNGENIRLKEFEIGYYIKNGKNYKEISTVKNRDKTPINLNDILKTTEFGFTEKSKDAHFFTKDVLDNLENILFIIDGTDIKNHKINVKIPLQVENINK